MGDSSVVLEVLGIKAYVSLSTKLDVKTAERFIRVVNKHFGGSKSQALREAIDLFLQKYEK